MASLQGLWASSCDTLSEKALGDWARLMNPGLREGGPSCDRISEAWPDLPAEVRQALITLVLALVSPRSVEDGPQQGTTG